MHAITRSSIIELSKNSKDAMIILHGCNCFNIMGNGLSGVLADLYPIVRELDSSTPYAESSKMGTILKCKVNEKLSVINCYCQYHVSTGIVQVNYNSLSKCLRRVQSLSKDEYIFCGAIGCGSGKGDPITSIALIKKELPKGKLTIIG